VSVHVTLWTVWWHYVSWQAVQTMRGNFVMIFQQWEAVIRSITHLFSVTIGEQCVPSLCGIL
jgi:hypothetical protein